MSQERKSFSTPEGLFIRCGVCKTILFRKEFERNFKVCPQCGFHYRLSVKERIELLLDSGTFQESFSGLKTSDPLNFHCVKKYSDLVARSQQETGLEEAVVVGEGKLEGISLALAFFDFGFIGGSMGSVVGEKVTRLFEWARDEGKPVLMVVASGGARMQEGMYSLFQMAKTVIALKNYQQKGLPYVALLTNPTTGGVTASFASLADVVLAEPQALIGFAGPKVIEQTTGSRLPKGFQTAEFLLKHGFVDLVVPRSEQKETLKTLFNYLAGG